jgi:hypothetical protein
MRADELDHHTVVRSIGNARDEAEFVTTDIKYNTAIPNEVY